MCMSFCLSVCLSICLSFFLSTFLSGPSLKGRLYGFTLVRVFMSVCLSVCLSVFLLFFLSTFLSEPALKGRFYDFTAVCILSFFLSFKYVTFDGDILSFCFRPFLASFVQKSIWHFYAT